MSACGLWPRSSELLWCAARRYAGATRACALWDAPVCRLVHGRAASEKCAAYSALLVGLACSIQLHVSHECGV
eukprot:472515-Prymnesium_polylepis.1